VAANPIEKEEGMIRTIPAPGVNATTWLSTFGAKVAATARALGLVTVLYAIATAASVVSPAAVYAHREAPGGVSPEVGMYGEPAVAAAFWREQHASNCGEMAVADVVGQMTGREPTEQQITGLAETTPSTAGPGPIWKPMRFTDIRDLPTLLRHYGIEADNVQTDVDSLKRKLGAGHKVIVILNAETIWNRPGKRDAGNHFVVVTGIDTKSGVVHLNDSAISTGRDEKVSIATFEEAWAPNYHSAIVTQ
jgi:predicted double-glycine peptidase